MTQFYICFLTKFLKLSGWVEESTWLLVEPRQGEPCVPLGLYFCLHKDRQRGVVLTLFKLPQICESEAAVSCLG